MRPEKEGIVGEQIGMDDTGGQRSRPGLFEMRQFVCDHHRKARQDTIGARFGGLEQRRPAGDGERIRPLDLEIAARAVQLRQHFADLRAMLHARPAHRHAIEESDDDRRPSGETAQRRAAPIVNRQRTIDAAPRQMLHQAEKERQVGFDDTAFIEGENEKARFAMEQVVRILDALGNALARQQAAKLVALEEDREVLVGYFSIDGHSWSSGSGSRRFAVRVCPC